MAKIILTGYMGSGKTLVSEILQHKTGWKLIDLDRYIEQRNDASLQQIFSEKGEVYFRKLEHEAFLEVLNSSGDLILSLGGGTPCYAGNHLLLNGDGRKSFFLQTSVGELAARLSKADNSARPLIKDKSIEELTEFIAKHLFDRNFYYRHATHTITTDGKSAEEIAGEILRLA